MASRLAKTNGPGPAQAFAPGLTENFTLSGTADDLTVPAGCTLARLYATKECFVRTGVAAAAATGMPIGEKIDVYIAVVPGEIVSGIQGAGGGVLYVTWGAS
jgi:hypothetical protein